MAVNTNGLTAISTNNTTWTSPLVNEMPVAVASQIRGGLWLIEGGAPADGLLEIPGIMLQDGMIVYLQEGYTENGDGGLTRQGESYYQYTNDAARPANGVLENTQDMWQLFNTGGGGGGGGVAVADIAALNAVAAADPEPDAGEMFTVIDPRGADDANPAIQGLPAGTDWDAAATAELRLTVAWDTDNNDWDFVQLSAANEVDDFVRVDGSNAMTGSLTMNPGADIVLTGTDNAATPVNRTVTVSVPQNSADFAANYEVVLPPAQPTDDNRILRVSNAADDDGDIASPYTLEWAEGGGAGRAQVGANTPAVADSTQGDLFWDTDDGRLYIFITDATVVPGGAAWVPASPV